MTESKTTILFHGYPVRDITDEFIAIRKCDLAGYSFFPEKSTSKNLNLYCKHCITDKIQTYPVNTGTKLLDESEWKNIICYMCRDCKDKYDKELQLYISLMIRDQQKKTNELLETLISILKK